MLAVRVGEGIITRLETMSSSEPTREDVEAYLRRFVGAKSIGGTMMLALLTKVERLRDAMASAGENVRGTGLRTAEVAEENAKLRMRKRLPRGRVSWSNHLNPKASEIKIELQRAVEQGDPPTARLAADWRERMEDMIWTLMTTPEFVYLP